MTPTTLAGLLCLAAGTPNPSSDTTGCGQPRPADWIERLMREDPQGRFAEILENPREHRVQVLVAEMVRGQEGGTCLRRSGFRVDAEYFYPASAIKIVGAIAALLETQARQREVPALHVDTPLLVRPASVRIEDGRRIEISPPSPAQSLRQVIEETLGPSSNAGFNWLFDVAGPDGIRRAMREAGFTSVRVRHRLAERGFPTEAHRFAPPVDAILEGAGREIWPLRRAEAPAASPPAPELRIGRAHVDPESGEVVEAPFDFRTKNAISLRDLQDILIDLVKPSLNRPPAARLPLSGVHREVLVGAMQVIPPAPGPPPASAPDRVRYKPLLTGLRRGVETPEALRYVNKAGRAYGFLIDNGFVEDPRSGRGFFVAVVIYANPNGVVGDDQYAYDTISFPFVEALGERLAQTLLRPNNAAPPRTGSNAGSNAGRTD